MVNVILLFKHSCAWELKFIVINKKEIGFDMLFVIRLRYSGFNGLKLTLDLDG